MFGNPWRYSTLIVAAVLIGCGPSQEAAVFQSTFGYSAEVPSHWKLIDRTAFKDYRDVTEVLDLGITSPAIEGIVRDSLRHDEFDFFLIIDDSSDVVGTVAGAIDEDPGVNTEAELKDLCSWLPQGFSGSTSRKIHVAACEYRRRAGTNSVYVSIDGEASALSTRMYMIPKSDGLVLLVSVTAPPDAILSVESAFERFISSIKI